MHIRSSRISGVRALAVSVFQQRAELVMGGRRNTSWVSVICSSGVFVCISGSLKDHIPSSMVTGVCHVGQGWHQFFYYKGSAGVLEGTCYYFTVGALTHGRGDGIAMRS